MAAEYFKLTGTNGSGEPRDSYLGTQPVRLIFPFNRIGATLPQSVSQFLGNRTLGTGWSDAVLRSRLHGDHGSVRG